MNTEEVKNLFLDNSYSEEYFNIITTEFTGVGEKHHILPKSLYPEYSKEPWNLVNLSYESHYRVHELLPFMVFDEDHKFKMLCAWNFISGITENKYVTSEGYKEIKQLLSEARSVKMTGVGNHQYGKTGVDSVWFGKVGPNKDRSWSEETLAKLSACRTGEKNHLFGKHHTDETKQKIGAANSGENNYWYGKTTTDKQKAAASHTALNRKWTEAERDLVRKKASIKVEIDGVIYESQKVAAMILNKSQSTIGNWVKSGKAKSLEAGKRPTRRGGGNTQVNNIPVSVAELVFSSQTEAASHFNVCRNTILNWVKSGKAAKLTKEPKQC